MLLGISPHEIEKKKRAFFTLGLGLIFGPKNAVGKSLDGDIKSGRNCFISELQYIMEELKMNLGMFVV
jgi:hypothetical protein